ncbi:MAG TPA: FoF1 ATP synthase subunit gamma [Oculatellaceae cyanobacterium]
MSHTKELKQRFENIHDLRGIISAMKSLAFMETKKLHRYLADQGRGASSIEAAAEDFLTFYPLLFDSADSSKSLLVVIGAERGFCGNFNEELIVAAHRICSTHHPSQSGQPAIIAVGERLSAKLQHALPIFQTIHGATFAEEVPGVLAQLALTVNTEVESGRYSLANLKILAHQYGVTGVSTVQPLPSPAKHARTFGTPPHLTLAPPRLFSLMLEQYLRFALYHIFYSSLMSENAMRTTHLDSALQRLDSGYEQLKLEYHRARQEEITEEIEVLLMNATVMNLHAPKENLL